MRKCNFFLHINYSLVLLLPIHVLRRTIKYSKLTIIISRDSLRKVVMYQTVNKTPTDRCTAQLLFQHRIQQF